MRILNKKGNTLIEVVISLVVSSLILVFACSFFFTGEKMMDRTLKNNSYKMIGDNICTFISERLEFSSGVEVLDSQNVSDASYENVIYVSPIDYLGMKNKTNDDDNIFGEDFYDGTRISVIYKVYEENCIKITVNVLSDDYSETLYTTSNTVRPASSYVDTSFFTIDESLINEDLEDTIISYK